MPHWRGGAGGRSVQGHEHDRLPRAALAYFELVQPRFGEGPLEDARPPRFANFVGTVFLGAASVAYATGADPLGTVLGGLVAGLALLAAVTAAAMSHQLSSPRRRDRARRRSSP